MSFTSGCSMNFHHHSVGEFSWFVFFEKKQVENSLTDIIVLKWCLAFQRRTPKNSWSGKTWQNEVASLAVLNRYFGISPRELYWEVPQKTPEISQVLQTYSWKFQPGTSRNVEKAWLTGKCPQSPQSPIEKTHISESSRLLTSTRPLPPKNRTPPMRMQMANANWMNSNLGSAVQ